jgi:hypothetical protein
MRLPTGSFFPVLASLFLTLLLAACSSWHEQSGPVPEVLAAKHPGTVRVTRQDESRVVLTEPQVTGEGLQGQVDGKPTEVPLSDVKSIALRQGDTGASVGLVVFLAAVLVGGFFALGSSAASD